MPSGLIHYGEGAVLPDPFIVKNCGAVAVQELDKLIGMLKERGCGLRPGQQPGEQLRAASMAAMDELIDLKRTSSFVYEAAGARVVFAPDLGARVFCELDGLLLHRLDLENVRTPNRPFNNFGGNNFWPAPEGGQVRLQLRGRHLARSAGHQRSALCDGRSRRLPARERRKRTTLKNRNGVAMDVVMQREFAVVQPSRLVADAATRQRLRLYGGRSTSTSRSRVSIDDALLACWTLEQFDASDATISFARVACPARGHQLRFLRSSGRPDRVRRRVASSTGPTAANVARSGSGKASTPGSSDSSIWSARLLCVREIVGPPGRLVLQHRGQRSAAGPVFRGGHLQHLQW